MARETSNSGDEAFPWRLGVFDAHCHPTDTVPSIDKIAAMKTRALTIMATRGQDQSMVADFADRLGISGDSLPMLISADFVKTQGHLVPSFGWHPWFSHQIYDDALCAQMQSVDKTEHYNRVITPVPGDDDTFITSLPNPRPLSGLIDQTRSYLKRYPFALVGEIGLDRAFRIPGLKMVDSEYERDTVLTPGGREGRRLSPYRVNINHQRRILKAQLNLAGDMQRAVSVHGVAAHGVLFETLQETWHGHEKSVLSRRERKWKANVDAAHKGEALPEERSSNSGGPNPFPPRICLHSYSGSPDTLRQYLHPSIPTVIFFSFSRLVNFSSSTSNKAVDAIKAVPNDRILSESDFHAAGEKMDDLLEDIIRTICGIKGWSLEEGVEQLATNWISYTFGGA